jgi:hypothetical protein
MGIWVFSTIGTILFLFSIVSFHNSKSYDHTYPPRSSWHHLDPISYPSKSCLSGSHIFKLQLCYLSKMCFVLIIGVVTLHTTYPYSMYPIESWNHILKCHSFTSNPILTYSCSLVLHYSICKWVDWVRQCFTNPYPKPKCNAYYFWVIVVTFIQ